MRGPWAHTLWSPCERAGVEVVHYAPTLEEFSSRLVAALRRSPLIGFDALGSMPCTARDRGLWLEFGVYRGGTISRISRFRNRSAAARLRRMDEPTYGFDSFLGLPEPWRPDADSGRSAGLGRGAFSLRGQPPFAADGAVLQWVVGWYNETLPRFLDARPGAHVSFLHVDSDLYSSAATIFRELGRRRFLRAGCVIVFDELFNFPSFEQHEMRALWEFMRPASHLSIEVIGTSTNSVPLRPVANRHPQSAAIRLVRNSAPSRSRAPRDGQPRLPPALHVR